MFQSCLAAKPLQVTVIPDFPDPQDTVGCTHMHIYMHIHMHIYMHIYMHIGSPSLSSRPAPPPAPPRVPGIWVFWNNAYL